MFGPLIRKAQQVLEDPVLRRWLLRRLVRAEKSVPDFVTGRPPYLPIPDTTQLEPAPNAFRAGNFASPTAPICVSLPGENVKLSPDDPGELFAKRYADLETELGAHRFAWVPVAGDDLDPDWVAALWVRWADRFGDNLTGWPWHAYTAGERAINIIEFAQRYGAPSDAGDFVSLLRLHAETILGGLEYFGDHYTSNHLSNNGRGLLRIGAALRNGTYAETGAQIMIAEAGRIFGRSGVLREGSTHYHVLATRNYIDGWLAASSMELSGANLLRDIAARALAVIPGLTLSGRFPLIGDISPDVPPTYLDCLIGRAECTGWIGNLERKDRDTVLCLLQNRETVSSARLAEDGWHRFGAGRWDALAFISPDGWPPMPGHGHDDLCSFELHDGKTPVLIDPGRGSYTDTLYESADVHNGLLLDDRGPSPRNRPYYSKAFRDLVINEKPAMQRTRAGQHLRHAGFEYLPNFGPVSREWRFADTGVNIVDRIDGRGNAKIRRQFFTPHSVSRDRSGAVIHAGNAEYRILPGADFTLKDMSYWTAYGKSAPGTMIVSEFTGALPIDCAAQIERV